MTHYSLEFCNKVFGWDFTPTSYEPTHQRRTTADGSEPGAQANNVASREYKEFTRDQRVVDFCHAHKLTLGRKRQWYWCSNQENKDGTPKWGQVNGLPTTRGIPRITNGVDVWIELASGELFLGHQDWWQGERREGVSYPRKRSLKKVLAESEDSDDLRATLMAMLRA